MPRIMLLTDSVSSDAHPKSATASGGKTLASNSVELAKQGFRRVHTKLVRYSCTDWSTGSAAGLPPADELAKAAPCPDLPHRAAHRPTAETNAANNSQNRGRSLDRCIVGDLAGEQAAHGASAGRHVCAAQAAGRLLRLRVGGAARQRLGPADRALSLPELSPVDRRRV